MTRGKLILLGRGQLVYTSVEFNGDMYPDGHGKEIISAFRTGLLKEGSLFERYVSRFDERNFHYASCYGEQLVSLSIFGEEKILDVTENWTDYLYIVNESGGEYTILTQKGAKIVKEGQLAIVCFQELKTLLDPLLENEKRSGFLIAKDEFVAILQRLKDSRDLVVEIDERLRNFKDDHVRDFCSGAGLMITHETEVIRLLELLTEDKLKDIDYFIYELDFGRGYQEGSITRKDGSYIDLSTADKLYDYLVEYQKA